MRATNIRSTIKLSEIEKCINFGSPKDFRELFRGQVITATLDDINQLDAMLLAERRDFSLTKSDLINDIKDISSEDFNISPRSKRYESIIHIYINRLIDAYYTLVNNYNIPAKDASVILPLALKTKVKISISGFDILKLFKYLEIQDILHSGVGEGTIFPNKQSRNIETLFTHLLESYINTLRNKDRYAFIKYKDTNINNISELENIIQENFELSRESDDTLINNLYDTSVFKHIYIQTVQTMSIDTYIRLLSLTDMSPKRNSLKAVKKNVIVPDSIKACPDALKIFINATEFATKTRAGIKGQYILNELYMINELMDISFGSSLIEDIRHFRDLVHDVYCDQKVMSFFNQRLEIITSQLNDESKKFLESFIYV